MRPDAMTTPTLLTTSPSSRLPRRLGYAAVVLVAVVALLAGYYVAIDRETTTVDRARGVQALTVADGFLALSAGTTHFRWDGLEGRPVVVLVHGYMDTMADWDAVVPVLTSAGFRVLRIDLIGHGLSDRPSGALTRERFSQQLLEVLDRLHVVRPDLVGHSLGGAIAIDFTARHPDRVRRLAVLAPAVAVDLPPMRVLRVPGVGQFLARTYFIGATTKLLAPYASRGERWAVAAIDGLKCRGTEAGYLSVITGDGFSDYRPACATVGKQRRRVLLAWGSGDVLVSGAAMRDARAALGDVEWHQFDGAPHELPMKTPSLVNPLLVKFLNAPD